MQQLTFSGFISQLAAAGVHIAAGARRLYVLIVSQGNEHITETATGKVIIRYVDGATQISDALPADEGRLAFRDKIAVNPYPESDWRHNEWQFGWDTAEQCNPELFDHTANKFKSQ